ncbi:J domain-containing protein [Nannocystis exedens]|uniref:J domain-containing protein n=1 Tax=Nannocystis exedens TaxID=54 RepID=UPI000BBA0B63|nr:J domain-containing protein [Nannocystis exedens]PCC66481.1 Chaperone protein DnaJ [Nannocystis exedens]
MKEEAIVKKPRDPFKVLGVKRSCSREELKRAYRSAVRRTHPDATRRDTRSEFEEVEAAYAACARVLETLPANGPLPPWAEAVAAAVERELAGLAGELSRAKQATTPSAAFGELGAAAARGERYYESSKKLVAGVRGLFKRLTGNVT